MKLSLLLIGFLCLFSDHARATLTYACSNCPSNTITVDGATSYYFSNIDSDYSNTDTTNCSTAVNPNCRKPTDTLSFSVVINNKDVTASSKLYLFISTTTPQGDPGTGESLTANAADTASGFSNGSTVTLSTTFQNFCSKATTQLGSMCDGASYVMAHIVLDTDNSLTWTPTSSPADEKVSFRFYTQSTITQYSTTSPADGISDFLAFPGDEAIHIKNVTLGTGVPSTVNTIGAQGIIFYYNQTTDPTSFDTSTTSSYSSFTNDNGDLSSNYVNNLINGLPYCVVPAIVDNAGNIGYIFEAGAARTSRMCTTPDQIIGILDQNGKCFIATAAFGSPMEKQVQILRNFRDKFLIPHKWGRSFVSWYYKHSPAWAENIRQSELKKSTTRFFLWPVVGYSSLALEWGATNAGLFAATVLMLPLLLIQIFRRRRREN